MAGHLDPDVLADFREGLLGQRRSARIRAHLGTCPTCASLDKELAQVTELLASAPPPRMPDRLVTRLENALAAEAAARTANQHPAGQGTRAADTASGAAGSPDRRPRQAGRRSWQLRPATLGVAAALAAVLAVGSYGLANLHSGAGAGNTASSAAGRPAHGSAGTLAPHANGVSNGAADEPARPPVQLQVIESGTDYLPSRLASQAQTVLAGHPVNGSAQRGIQTTRPAAGPLTSLPGNTSQLRSCVGAVTHGRSPLLVDQAQYQGRPATIIVLAPTPGRAGQIWVAGPACSAASPDLIAHRQFSTG
jgi:hypothetical protein